MANEERMNKIRASAREHEGRYLLPRRFTKPLLDEWKTDTDLEWDACEELVQCGDAKWLRNSTLSPCIVFRMKEPP